MGRTPLGSPLYPPLPRRQTCAKSHFRKVCFLTPKNRRRGILAFFDPKKKGCFFRSRSRFLSKSEILGSRDRGQKSTVFAPEPKNPQIWPKTKLRGYWRGLGGVPDPKMGVPPRKPTFRRPPKNRHFSTNRKKSCRLRNNGVRESAEIGTFVKL